MPNTPKVVDREALKEFRKRNDQRYVLEGEYSPVTKVGESDAADNLAPYSEHSGSNDTTPFVFQSSGGSRDIGSLAYLKSLRGNTVVFNQLFLDTSNPLSINLDNTEGSETIYASSIIGSSNYRMILGHKYLIKLDNVPERVGADTRIYITTINSQTNLMPVSKQANIITVNNIEANARPALIFLCHIGEKIEYNGNVQIFDLTQMFGAGKEPTTVEEFNRLFPLPYYEYNAGELLSCKVNGYKTVGYNQFNKDDSSSIYNSVFISSVGTSGGTGDTNYSVVIPIIPGQKYTIERTSVISPRFRAASYPTLPKSNMTFIHHAQNDAGLSIQVQTGIEDRYLIVNLDITESTFLQQLNNLCIHLTWDGTHTGYKPYEEYRYQLPNVALRSAGLVYDSVLPSGLLTRRIGVVDLGTLNGWSNYGTGLDTERVTTSALSSLIKSTPVTSLGNLLSKFKAIKYNDLYGSNENGIALEGTNLYIKDSSIIGLTTNEQIKSALSGVYLFYELAEPTEEIVNGYQENTLIDDWGTQEFLYDSDIDIPVPQGNEFFYPVDYKAFIDSVGGRDDIEYDASKIASHDELAEALADIDLSDYVKADGTTEASKVNFGDGATVTKDGSNRVNLNYGNQAKVKVGSSETTFENRIGFGSDNTNDIGRKEVRVRDIYIAGKLKDGTNEVSVADLKALIDYAKLQGWIQ